MDNHYQQQQNSLGRRVAVFLEEVWPSVNRMLTDAFWGFISLLKMFISAIWR